MMAREETWDLTPLQNHHPTEGNEQPNRWMSTTVEAHQAYGRRNKRDERIPFHLCKDAYGTELDEASTQTRRARTRTCLLVYNLLS
ncbi:hypothetical protein YC2023_036671 [Brassica napus]